MKIKSIKSLIIIIGCISCATPKFTLNKIGGLNEAINNAINDFYHSKEASKGKIYDVSYKYLENNVIGISILDCTDGKVSISKEIKIGSTSNYFPTRYIEMGNSLFYWHDSTMLITENIINKLLEYNHIDSTYYYNVENYTFYSDDKTKATHYYFCSKNLAKYIKRKSNIALGYGILPKVKCN